jgi:flagellar basal-body rod protein FlgC
MNLYDSMEVLASGLSAERTRLDVTSSNMANAQTTRTAEGGPYRRRDPVFAAAEWGGEAFGQTLAGVEVPEVVADQDPPRMVFDPGHPDANGEGYVAMPNVSMVEEMVNMMNASRSYEAQLTAMHGLVDMTEKALSLGK